VCVCVCVCVHSLSRPVYLYDTGPTLSLAQSISMTSAHSLPRPVYLYDRLPTLSLAQSISMIQAHSSLLSRSRSLSILHPLTRKSPTLTTRHSFLLCWHLEFLYVVLLLLLDVAHYVIRVGFFLYFFLEKKSERVNAYRRRGGSTEKAGSLQMFVMHTLSNTFVCRKTFDIKYIPQQLRVKRREDLIFSKQIPESNRSSFITRLI